MGEKPGDITREIGDLRDETEIIIEELARRANPGNVARGVAHSVTDRAGEVASTVTTKAEGAAGNVRYRVNTLSHDVGQALPTPVRRNPSVAGGAVLGLVASLGAYLVANIVHEREKSAPEKATLRVQQSAGDLRGGLNRVQVAIQKVREELDKGRRIQIVAQREEPTMLKRLIWVGMVSVMGALGAMLFQRLSAQVWRSTMHEEPPKK